MMSFHLNALKGVIYGIPLGNLMGVVKGGY